eukprot:285063-Lingulodinium_polyedra.AAC.1
MASVSFIAQDRPVSAAVAEPFPSSWGSPRLAPLRSWVMTSSASRGIHDASSRCRRWTTWRSQQA